MSEISNYYDLGPKKANADSIVFLLHGLGSNGRDLISLAPYWAREMPRTVFISPDAPFACDMTPPGYPDSYQWFSLQSRDPEFILEGIQNVFPVLDDFIAAQAERLEVPMERIIISGFSQGCMMSLYTALHQKSSIAGVLGYSGAFVNEEDFDYTAAPRFPVYLVHGESDDVVPFSSYRFARSKLLKEGYDIDGHSTPGLGHSIDEKGISAGLEFIKKVLP